MTSPASSRKLVSTSMGLRVSRADLIYLLLANLTEFPESSKWGAWEEQLLNLIENTIDQADEDVWSQVFDMLAAADNEEGHDILVEALQDQTLTATLECVEGREDQVGHLFAIPVIISCDEEFGSSVVPKDLFRSVREAFNNSDLFGKAEVSLSNYLYSALELGLPWGMYPPFIRNQVLAAKIDASAPEKALLQREALPGWRAPGQDSSELRFLVGVFAAPAGSVIPSLDCDPEVEAMRKLEAWHDDLGQRLQRAIKATAPGVTLRLGVIERFYSARSKGIQDFKLHQATCELHRTLKDAALLPAEATAIVALYEDEDGDLFARASILEKQRMRLVGGCDFLLALDETAEEGLDLMVELLEGAGVDVDQVLEGVSDDEHCEGCGAPLYLAPGAEASGLSLRHLGDDEAPTMH